MTELTDSETENAKHQSGKNMHCKFPPRFYKKKQDNKKAGKPKTTQQ